MKLHKLIWTMSVVLCAVVAMGHGYGHHIATPHQIAVSQRATVASGTGTTDPGYPDSTTVI